MFSHRQLLTTDLDCSEMFDTFRLIAHQSEFDYCDLESNTNTAMNKVFKKIVIDSATSTCHNCFTAVTQYIRRLVKGCHNKEL